MPNSPAVGFARFVDQSRAAFAAGKSKREIRTELINAGLSFDAASHVLSAMSETILSRAA